MKKFQRISIIWTILFFVIAAIIIPIIVNVVSDLIFERLTESSDELVQTKELPKSGKLYAFPPPLSSSKFVTQGNELRLEAGSEYFQAVVSAKPDEVLARKELLVEVR